MQNQISIYSNKVKTILLASLFGIFLAGCGSTNWGFPYKATIQQGNWVTEEQVDQLETGMTRQQVMFVLGTPTLQDIFHSQRWDYPYYNQPGYGTKELRKFTVWFENDLLVRWAGDKQPDRQPFEKTDSGSQEDTDNYESNNNDTVDIKTDIGTVELEPEKDQIGIEFE